MPNSTRSVHPATRAKRALTGTLLAPSRETWSVEVIYDALGTIEERAAQYVPKLRELQAANGRLELTSARLQQGELVANAAGALTLNPRGALNGEINLTVINFGKLLQVLGVDRMIAQAVPQATIDKLAPGLDRVMPGLGGLLRGNTGAASGGAAPLAAAAVGGKSTELDGQRAISMMLRLSDGTAYLGPLKVGQIPPLF